MIGVVRMIKSVLKRNIARHMQEWLITCFGTMSFVYIIGGTVFLKEFMTIVAIMTFFFVLIMSFSEIFGAV